MRTWKTEFDTGYSVPAEICQLVDSGQLEDVSWHNDTCPSFARADVPVEDKDLRLWVDHANPYQREVETNNRFTVTVQGDDYYHCLYDGDDVSEALRAFLGGAYAAQN